MSFNSFLLLYTILTIRLAQAALSICPDTTDAAFDYVVVGAGAGGGPLAARLAESGFSGSFYRPTIAIMQAERHSI